MGLGLPLVRQIVEQHGGEIGVDTVLEEGTTITLTLPLPASGNAGTAPEN